MEELFDLGQARIDSDHCGSTFGEQVVAEAASAVHLDQQAPEVAERVLACLQECSPFAAEDARLRPARGDASSLVRTPAEKR
jgi:hypothetical protein